MKGLVLVKREDHYGLYNEDGHKIAATIDGCNSKLSKENCDSIFGVVDVDDLAYKHRRVYQDSFEGMNECIMKDAMHQQVGFVAGFNKAMELSKDKLVTIKELKIIMLELFYLEKNEDEAEDMFRERQLAFIENNIQSLQQPTKIEVEVEQTLVQSSIDGEAIWKYKLDENGCLVLKRI